MRGRVKWWVIGAVGFGLVVFAWACQPRKQETAGSSDSTTTTSAAADTALTPELRQGQQDYLAYCAMCHGPWGEGDGPLAADLRKNSGVGPAQINNAARLAEIGREGIVQVITQGGSGTHRSNLMPPFRNQVPPAVIQSIAAWVLAMPTIKPGIPRSTVDKYLAAPRGVPEDGRKLFVYYCTMCHGPEAKGNGFMADTIAARYKVHPRDLTDSSYFAGKSDKELFETISLGGRYTGHSAVMPGWELPLAPGQIKDLISYIRSISRTPSQP